MIWPRFIIRGIQGENKVCLFSGKDSVNREKEKSFFPN